MHASPAYAPLVMMCVPGATTPLCFEAEARASMATRVDTLHEFHCARIGYEAFPPAKM